MVEYWLNPCGKICKALLSAVLIFQLTGCGTLLYPERRGQKAGHLDAGVVILDGLGLLLFLIPGIIAFAVDFGNGTIYLPATAPLAPQASLRDMRQIKFDPKHTSLAQLETIIKNQTGYTVHLTGDNVKVARLKNKQDMLVRLAEVMPSVEHNRLALAN